MIMEPFVLSVMPVQKISYCKKKNKYAVLLVSPDNFKQVQGVLLLTEVSFLACVPLCHRVSRYITVFEPRRPRSCGKDSCSQDVKSPQKMISS